MQRKTSKLERKLRVMYIYLHKKINGGIYMQKKDRERDSKRQLEVYAIGKPDMDKMSKGDMKVFYRTLLRCAVDYLRQNGNK